MIKIALVLALTFTAAPAMAKDGDWRVGTNQIHLIYSDIDTGTPAGRAAFLARVERAADKLCDVEVLGADKMACIKSVVSAAAADRGGYALTRAIAERTGRALADK